MKRINISILTLLALLFMAACDTDRDSNPTLVDATEFVLNEPAFAETLYDLEHSTTLELTCSQPNYGFPVAMKYLVQVSLTGEFNEAVGEDVPATYKTLNTTFTNARMNVDALQVAVAIVELSGLEKEEDFNEQYADPTSIHIRVLASVENGMKPILSNVITLKKVQAYYALAPMDMPEEMYIIGSIVDWDEKKGIDMVPVHSAPGKFWRLVYMPADAEFKLNSAKAWNGSEFGFEGTTLPNADYAGLSNNNGNIKVANAGWYLMVVTTEVVSREYMYTVELLEPVVYLCGDAAGGTWGAGADNKFSVPADADGEFVSPAFTAVPGDGGIRACVVLDGIDWWKTEFMVFDGEVKYRGTGDDQDRVSGAVGQKLYINFTAGTGSIK